jgi:signal transduction histidine kinase
MVALLAQYRTTFMSISYLAIGGASTYWFAITVTSQYPDLSASDAFVLSVLRLSLIFVGGAGLGAMTALAWCVAGLLVAEVAIVIAALQTGIPLTVDGTALIALVVVGLTLAIVNHGQSWMRRVQPTLHRAVSEEKLASIRFGIEAKAAAIMHDTVLNHLAAIASAPDGPLSAQLQKQIERDLEILVGEEWLAESSASVDARARSDWQHSQLFQAIADTRMLGLEIDVSGDLAAVGRLSGDRSTALGLATRQCLVNVLKHAGTGQAEVVVYASEDEVSVMVVDAGKGFAEAETGSDRLGLRQSVRRRMEAVGGGVQVWSTPGRGTSVLIRVPIGRTQPAEVDA